MQYTSSGDLNRATAYVYVETDNENTTASGFFFKFKDINSLFLITNKHVVENVKTLVISIHTDIKEPCYIIYTSELQKQIILHPQDEVDLCLVKIDENKLSFSPEYINLESSQINHIDESMIVTKEMCEKLNYCEDVIMFGAPNTLYDIKNNLSISYRGMTSTHAGSKYRDLEEFMVDIPSYPGSSGSAIYLCNRKTMSEFSKTKLLGIFSKAQYDHHSQNDKKYVHIGKAVNAYKLFDIKKLI